MYCVFHHISGHLPRQIWFWKISTKTWASVRPPRPLLGQMPKFFRKSILRAPLTQIKDQFICGAKPSPLIIEMPILSFQSSSAFAGYSSYIWLVSVQHLKGNQTNFTFYDSGHVTQNKLASSKLRLSQSETITHPPTYSLTGVKCRATSVAKNCLIQQEKGCGSILRPRRPSCFRGATRTS